MKEHGYPIGERAYIRSTLNDREELKLFLNDTVSLKSEDDDMYIHYIQYLKDHDDEETM